MRDWHVLSVHLERMAQAFARCCPVSPWREPATWRRRAASFRQRPAASERTCCITARCCTTSTWALTRICARRRGSRVSRSVRMRTSSAICQALLPNCSAESGRVGAVEVRRGYPPAGGSAVAEKYSQEEWTRRRWATPALTIALARQSGSSRCSRCPCTIPLAANLPEFQGETAISHRVPLRSPHKFLRVGWLRRVPRHQEQERRYVPISAVSHRTFHQAAVHAGDALADGALLAA